MNEQAVAVVGMAGRFPGAPDLDTYWQNLRAGIESISFYTADELRAEGFDDATLEHPDFVPATGELAGSDLFDAAFFDYSPREAELIDPQQRVFLECASEALERANVVPSHDLRVGVLGSAGMNTYLVLNVLAHPEVIEASGAPQVIISNDKDYLALRAAYKLGLTGPALTVQTSCSSSLVAVHLGCRMLRTFDADVVLAGGASVGSPQRRGYVFHKGGVSSPDGHCRAFDARAEGLAAGSGVGVVVLKRLEDALADRDRIHAVILGSAVNNDGSAKVGFTAPSVAMQAAVIAEAHEVAEVGADSIGYVEAHGTATPLGDPVEVAALTRAFRRSTRSEAYCALGSVKTNLGHLDAAAGVAGLIKTVLALEHREIPASLNFHEPNPRIDFAHSPFYVNTETRPWQRNGHPRRAGVSAFGLGGTNAHVVLEEARPGAPATPSPWPQLLVTSAKTPTAGDTLRQRLADHLSDHPDLDLADVAHTLLTGRRGHKYRHAVVCGTREEAIAALRAPSVAAHVTSGDPRVVFAFPGVTAVTAGTGSELARRYPVYRAAIDECAGMLQVRDKTPQASAGATFTIAYGLARLFESWGIVPQAMVGHSMGEYVAACLSGVLTLPDALHLLAVRYELMARLPAGAMVSVQAPAADLHDLLDGDLAIAALNTPESTVVSGPVPAVDRLVATLTDRGIRLVRLGVQVATHSPMLDEVLDEFAAAVDGVARQAPRRPYVSTLTGDWIRAEDVLDRGYWVRQFRETVRFADAVTTLATGGDTVYVETGPGQALTALLRAQAKLVVPTLPDPRRPRPELAHVLDAVGRLWQAGVPITGAALAGDEVRNRVQLPTYPFERQRYWLPPKSTPAEPTTRYAVPSWRRTPLTGHRTAEPVTGCWLVLDDRFGERLAGRLRADGAEVVTVSSGPAFEARDGGYRLDPANPDHLTRLVGDLTASGRRPRHLVHTGMRHCGPQCGIDRTATPHCGPQCGIPDATEALDVELTAGVAAVAQLCRELGGPLDVWLVTEAAEDVTGGEALCPAAALRLGLSRALPAQHPGLTCRVIDVDGDTPVSHLVAEFRAGGTPHVAYRGPHRWTPAFEAVTLDAPAAPALPDGGVYLVTSGLDDYSAVVAEQLSAANRGHVVILEPGPVDPDGDRGRLYQQLRRGGASVEAVEADVTRPGALEEAVAEIRGRHGDLAGVIHTAFTVEPPADPADPATGPAAVRHARHRAASSLALAAALAPNGPYFCLLQSTTTDRAGAHGRIGTAAAAAYTDTLADQLNRAGGRWLSICWDDTTAAPGVAEVAEVLGRVLASDHHRVRVAPAADRPAPSAPPQTSGGGYDRPPLLTPYQAPRNDIEAAIVAIWEEVLGIRPLGVDDDFFALGGHSLMGTQIVARLQQSFGVDFPLRDLFDAATAADMARRVVELRALDTADDDLEALLAELEADADLPTDAAPHVDNFEPSR